MFQIAVYGKGGIGKSTVSANISVSLAKNGLKVMQVGCDPKHDSTRLLLGGHTQLTVLDYIRQTHVSRRKLEDVIKIGTFGVVCSEAGGPEPGIGCAGRGILTTFDTLSKLGADNLDVDVRLYDVLGDVVCGGFAVPLREEYADAVLIVTSGEFMSMYAANNIMKGLLNFSGRPRVAGMILNCRGVDNELESVKRLSDAVGVPIISIIPRSKMFADAESEGHTVCELFSDSDIAQDFDRVSTILSEISLGNGKLYHPMPLDDDQLNDLAAGREISGGKGRSGASRNSCSNCRVDRDQKSSPSSSEHAIVGSCGAYGAVSACLNVRDLAVIMHGPRSCSYIAASTADRVSASKKDRKAIHRASFPSANLISTDMTDEVSIFGGEQILEDVLREQVELRKYEMVVVSACMPGIIGDDIRKTAEKVVLDNPQVTIRTISTDGNINGDYQDGFIRASETLAHVIDPTLKSEKGYVNIIGSSFFRMDIRENANALDGMLDIFGLKINCRFLGMCTLDDINHFFRAGINMPLVDDWFIPEMINKIEGVTGRRVILSPTPKGLQGTLDWIEFVGNELDLKEKAYECQLALKKRYFEGIESSKRILEGKRIIILDSSIENNDWFVSFLLELGLEILFIGRKRRNIHKIYSEGSIYIGKIVFMENYTRVDLENDVRDLDPDLIISDDYNIMETDCRWAICPKMNIGIDFLLEYAEYLSRLTKITLGKGWKEDRSWK